MSGYMERKRMEMKKSQTFKNAILWPVLASIGLIIIWIRISDNMARNFSSDVQMSFMFLLGAILIIWAGTSWSSWYKRKVDPEMPLRKLILQNIGMNLVVILMTILLTSFLTVDGEFIVALTYLLFGGMVSVSIVANLTHKFFEDVNKKLLYEALVMLVLFLVYCFLRLYLGTL